MTKKKEDTCCICGKKRSDVKSLFNGKSGYVCNECVEQMHFMNQSIDATNRGDINNIDMTDICNDYKVDYNKIPTPHEIKDYLDDYVIGQDEAKKTLAVAVYNHYKRLFKTQKSKSKRNKNTVELNKSNILVCGESGSGKSEMVRVIAKYLDVPMVIVDSTCFTEAGYVGEDVESMVSRLYQAADYNVEKTERGIIVADEIDKICSRSANPSITRDVNGTGVQQAMLKLLEGTDVLIQPEGGRKHPEAKMVKINTSNILFIGMGAFVGLEDIISSRMNTKSIGFTLQTEDDDEDEHPTKDSDSLIRYVESQDIKKYGFIPEMVGRLPVITYVEKLNKDALKKILTEPKNSIIKQYQKLFEIDGVKLTFTEDVYDYIVEKAEANETGARGLRTIVEKIMKDYMFDVPSMKNVKEVIIDAEYIASIDKKYKKSKEKAA